MDEDRTTEFSFILKPSEHGIGVFAAHDIKKETYLRLFGDEYKQGVAGYLSSIRNKDEVPAVFKNFCNDRGTQLICPKDFGVMPIGWYLNHSRKPNAVHKNYDFYAARDIREGEEILIDYNTLEEPESAKEDYY